jgi:hypothetical protein
MQSKARFAVPTNRAVPVLACGVPVAHKDSHACYTPSLIGE